MEQWVPKIHRKGHGELSRSNMSVLFFRAPSIRARQCVCAPAKGTDRACVRVCVWQTDVVPKRLALSDKESNTACSYNKRRWWVLQYNTFCVWLIGTGSPIAQKLCAGIELCINTLVNVRGWFRCGHWGCLRESTHTRRPVPGLTHRGRLHESAALRPAPVWCAPVCVCVVFFLNHILCVHPFSLLLWSLPLPAFIQNMFPQRKWAAVL